MWQAVILTSMMSIIHGVDMTIYVTCQIRLTPNNGSVLRQLDTVVDELLNTSEVSSGMEHITTL